MKKFGKFLKDFFTTNIPIKLLAVALAVLSVLFDKNSPNRISRR